MTKPFLTITALGGLGEIGLNCQLWETQEGIVIVDCGIMFPDDQQFGIDFIIPSIDYIISIKNKILGVILTHGHEDHIGAIPWLVKSIHGLHIYGSVFTLALTEHKLKEHALYDNTTLSTVTHKTKLSLGSLLFQFIPVSHSIPQCYALAVTSCVGKILHSGDFKIDHTPSDDMGTDIEALKNFAGKDGIRLLLSDSTNAGLKGHTYSEQYVKNSLYNIFKESTGRIIITLFSSHIERIQNICDIVQSFNKTLVVSGRNLINNVHKAKELGFLKIHCNFFTDNAVPTLLPEQTVIIATGSQGEPLSALMRIVSKEHRYLEIQKNDSVIMSSRVIPGNALAINRLINQIYKIGAKVYLNDNDAQTVHVSGHAYQEELEQLIKIVHPRYFVPIHGEYRQLVQHKELAIKQGVLEEHTFILENGMPLTLEPNNIYQGNRLDIQPIFIDGKNAGDVDACILKERQLLSEYGFIVVYFSKNIQKGVLIQKPSLISQGFIAEKNFYDILETAKQIAIEIISADLLIDNQSLEKKICSSLQNFFRSSIGRVPIIIPIINK